MPFSPPTRFSFLGHETTKNELMILLDNAGASCFSSLLFFPSTIGTPWTTDATIGFSSFTLVKREVDTLPFGGEIVESMAWMLSGGVLILPRVARSLCFWSCFLVL